MLGYASLPRLFAAGHACSDLTRVQVTSFVLHPGSMINTDIGRDSVGTKIMMAALSPFTKSIGQGLWRAVHAYVSV